MRKLLLTVAFAFILTVSLNAQSEEKKGCCSEKTAAVKTEKAEKSFCDVPEDGEASMTLTSDKKKTDTKKSKTAAKTGSCCATETKTAEIK